MNKTAKMFAIFGSAAILGALLMLGGCGSDSSPATQSNSSQLTTTDATLNTNGTVTTTTPVTATNAAGTVAVTIPAGVTITSPGSSFTALPTIVVTTPTSGVSGMPEPITPGLTLSSVAGAVDIVIGGKDTVTFSSPVTITIPNDPANTDTTVDTNKKDGTGWHHLGQGTLSADKKSVTIQVTNLCWYCVKPVYKTPTGSTGGSSTGGF